MSLSSFLQGSFPKLLLFKTVFNFSAAYIIFVQKWKAKWAELSEMQLGTNTENIGIEDTVIKKKPSAKADAHVRLQPTSRFCPA